MLNVFSKKPSAAAGINEPASPLPGSADKAGAVPRPGGPWGWVAAVFYGIGAAFFGGQLAVGVLLGIVLAMLGMSTSQINSWLMTPFGYMAYSLLGAAFVLILIGLYLRHKRADLTSLGLTRFRFRFIGIAIAATLAYLALYLVIITAVKALVPGLDLEQEQNLGVNDPQSNWQLAAIFVTLVILPPIIEEVVFRGFVYAGFRKSLSFVPTAIFTSILFAAGHLQFGYGAPLLWAAAIDTFVLSMVMCFVRERTGSIWPTIIMHALKNMLAFTFLYLIVA